MAISSSSDIVESDIILTDESLFLSTDDEAGDDAVSFGAPLPLLSLTSPTVTTSSGDVLLANTMPQARYMYGCAPTATAMLLGYYDLYGYRGNDFSDLIDGDVDLESRGSDSVKYTMNDFDSALGRATATQDYVSRFFSKDSIEVICTHFYTPTTPAEELEYSFVNGGAGPDLRTDNWNCLADYLGTGQIWRGNENLGTTSFYRMLEDAVADTSLQTYIDGDTQRTIEMRYRDILYGLYLYVQDKGYSLDMKVTGTHQIDVDGGSFTFEDYAKEIDAGRPVMVLIDGHIMTGYGYNATTREIIFDDCYEADQRMVWDGVYHYSGNDCGLNAILTVGLMAAGYDVDLAVSPYDEGSGITDKLIIATAENHLVSADYAFRNGPLYLNFAVSNLGANTASGDFDVMIYIDNELTDTLSMLSLAPETITRQSNISLASDLGVGLHTISITIDPDNEIQETSGTNNSATGTIMVLKEGSTVVEGIVKGVYSGQVSNDEYVYGAQLVVLEGGTAIGTVTQGKVISVSSDGISYISGLVVIQSGGRLQDAAVYQYAQLQMNGTAENVSVYDNGTALFYNGSVTSGITVFGNGIVNVLNGGTITGRIQMSENAQFFVEGGAVLDFDLSKATAGGDALVNNLALIHGLSLFSLTVTGTDANGLYSLAGGAAGFDKAITVKIAGGATIGTITVGDSFSIGAKTYELALSGDTLTLTVDGTIDFDISSLTPGNTPLYSGSDLVADADYQLIVSGSQTNGTYSLASDVTAFNNTITVKDVNDNELGTIIVGGVLLNGGRSYALNLSSEGLLSMTIASSSLSDVIASHPENLVISEGTYTGYKILNGVQTTIENGIFSDKPVYGGKNPAGDFGDLETMGSKTSPINTVITINDGTFQNVFGGDKVDSGYFNHYGNISLTVNGGSFSGQLAGGIRHNRSSLTEPAFAVLLGNINLTVNGGTFGKSIYGGCYASNRSVSGFTCINGNVTTTINVTGSISVAQSIVAGSYGNGSISGSVRLVVSGTGNLSVGEELWGGCGGDYYTLSNDKKRVFQSAVSGDRVLSFAGFTGNLATTKIRGFRSIEFVKDGDTVTDFSLSGEDYNLSDIQNWTFEDDCYVKGDFVNDFTGDTLNLVGFGSSEFTTPQTLMRDIDNKDSRNVFANFGSLGVYDEKNKVWTTAPIKMGDTTDDLVAVNATFSDNAWTWSAGGYNYSLGLVTSENTTDMVLTRTQIV